MKKYLNKNIFYQGDTSILLPLALCYIVAFIFLKTLMSGWSDGMLYNYLYSGNYVKTIVDLDILMAFVIYILLIYIISVGVFKKKKWCTLLSGPFTKKDIRRRELIIIVSSILLFIAFYLIIIGQIYIERTEIINYMGPVFLKFMSFDLMRLIGVAFVTVGGIFLLDSIFSNLYMFVTGSVFTGVYVIFTCWNLGYFMRYKDMTSSLEVKNAMNLIINSITGFLDLGYFNFRDIDIINMVMVCILLIVIGCVCGLIASKLTNKIKVENMNDGIMFKLPKRMAKFMICTITGLVLAPFVVDMARYDYILEINQELLIIVSVILVLTVISTIVIKGLEKKLGKEILC